jgi:glutamate-1-semialdehyde 2,1-aminomutase
MGLRYGAMKEVEAMALSAQQTASHGIDPACIRLLQTREEARFRATHAKSGALHERARRHLMHGVPLHWMSQWAGPYPIFAAQARNASLLDVDGNRYIDFCMGDSAALFGHANPAVAGAIADMIVSQGATYMLPTEDAIFVGEELTRRFKLPCWQVAVSATDANRFALRLARIVTGRDKVLVFNGKYHGSVDETQVELRDDQMVPQFGISPNGVAFQDTTKLIEFNDVGALAAALEPRDVAAVLAEPMMTNIGMVPAAPGFHEALRRLTRETGTVLIIDETHTICAGPGGCTALYGLDPDMMVIGKVWSAGIPSAVYGMSEAIRRAVEALTSGPGINHYGFGGTLAANALTMRAIRTTLEEVMTEKVYERMNGLAAKLEDLIGRHLREFRLPWHVTRVGSRVEYLYRPTPPRNGSEAAAARNDEIEALIHLYFLNRAILLTPFHNMTLVSPCTTEDDIDRFDAVFAELLTELTGGLS